MNQEPLELLPAQCALCRVDDAEPIAVGEDFEYRTAADSFLMMRCRRCGLVFLNPRPAAGEEPRIYPDKYHAFDFSETEFGLIRRMRRRLEARRLLKWCRRLPPDARILDVGCGDGFHLALLRDFGPPTWKLQGVDVDGRAVAQARKSGLNVFQGTIETMPREQPYDLALMIMTIEHLSEPVATVRAIAERLRPGSRLVIATDNVRSPDFAVFGGRHWGGYHFPRHNYLFEKGTLSRLATVAGLRVASVKTGLSPVNWVYSFRNWIDDWGGPRWLVNRFSLRSPVSLALFTVVDSPFSLMGRGGVLQAIFEKPQLQHDGVRNDGN